MKYARAMYIFCVLRISSASPAVVDWVVRILGTTIYATHGAMMGVLVAGVPDYGYYYYNKLSTLYIGNPLNSSELSLYKDNYTMLIPCGAIAGAAWGVWNSLSEETRTSITTASEAFIQDPSGVAKTSIQAAIKAHKIKKGI